MVCSGGPDFSMNARPMHAFNGVMTMGKLTALKIRRAKKPGRYGDGGGLYLAVNENGAKSWIFMWKEEDKKKKDETKEGGGRPKHYKRYAMGLGSARTLSLADAREEALKARKARLGNKDPRAERNARIAGVPTFGECADEYVETNKRSWSTKHAYQWQHTLSDNYIASLRSLAVNSITTERVLEVLQPIWQDKYITATRLRSRIEQVLDWAAVKKYRSGENPARWRGNLRHLLAKTKHTVSHRVAMPYADVPAFMATLRKQDSTTARALEFLILTATRAGEVFGAQWDEIDDDTWIIPPKRMKGGREHRVPLSKRCVELLWQLKQEQETTFPAKAVLVFPGVLTDKPLYHASMLTVLRELTRNTELTVHGFRSSFRDWAGDKTSFPREVVEFALAHGINDKTKEAYRRSTAVEKRHELMEAWAAYCELNEGNVIPISGKPIQAETGV